MLKECLKNIDVRNDTPFVNSGIILFSNADKRQYYITFGSEDLYSLYDYEEVESIKANGNDGYITIEVDRFDDDGYCEENYHGGRMFYRHDKHSGFINDYELIKDALEAIGCSNADDCFVLNKF